MNHRKSAVAIAVVAGFLASAAVAQQTGDDQHHPAGTAGPRAAPGIPMSGMAQGMPGGMTSGAGAMPMMGMMQMRGPDGMGAMMSGHVEGRIAFLKTELKITDAQQKLWDAVADAMRGEAKSMAGMARMGSGTTLPDKLASREKAMATRLEELRKLTAVVEPLYAALDSNQKKTADDLMSGPMGIGTMGMGMM